MGEKKKKSVQAEFVNWFGPLLNALRELGGSGKPKEVVAQIAKDLNIPDIYLGYWINKHHSMGYKEEYKPFEILKNRANMDEEPIWEEYKS